MFGRNKSNDVAGATATTENKGKPEIESYATYCGGHKLYPKERTCKIKLYADHCAITSPELRIPYKQMTKVDYINENGLAQFGLILTRKKQTYTVIEYNDEANTAQRILLIVVDQMGSRNLEKIQSALYQKMTAAKTA